MACLGFSFQVMLLRTEQSIDRTTTQTSDGEVFAVKAPRYTTLFLMFEDNKPKLKAGDYFSVVGSAGVAEQDSRIVLGTENANCWTIKVEQMEQR